MSVKMDVRLEIDPGKVARRFDPRFQRAQAYLDSEILRTTEPYLPFRTGMLARSGPASSKIGSGIITYNTPYARRLYYGKYHFSRAAHPQATSKWFEKSKAVNKKSWFKGVDNILRG